MLIYNCIETLVHVLTETLFFQMSTKSHFTRKHSVFLLEFYFSNMHIGWDIGDTDCMFLIAVFITLTIIKLTVIKLLILYY